MTDTTGQPRDHWTIEDSLALGKLAQADAKVFSDIILPSGRQLTAGQANALINDYRGRG